MPHKRPCIAIKKGIKQSYRLCIENVFANNDVWLNSSLVFAFETFLDGIGTFLRCYDAHMVFHMRLSLGERMWNSIDWVTRWLTTLAFLSEKSVKFELLALEDQVGLGYPYRHTEHMQIQGGYQIKKNLVLSFLFIGGHYSKLKAKLSIQVLGCFWWCQSNYNFHYFILELESIFNHLHYR